MSLTVEDIENALLQALSSDHDLSALVRYFSVLPDLGEGEVTRLIKNFPAVAVISHQGRWLQTATSGQDEVGLFAVLCATRNLRSPPAAALHGGTPAEVGVYDLVEGVRRVLSRPGALDLEGVYDCQPLRRILVLADGGVAVCAVEVEVTWRHQM